MVLTFILAGSCVRVSADTIINRTNPSIVNSQTTKIENPLAAGSVNELVAKLLDVVIKIGSLLAVVFIIYSGFLFVTAGGSTEKIESAKKVFLYCMIGTAIILGSKVIQVLIENTVKDVLG